MRCSVAAFAVLIILSRKPDVTVKHTARVLVRPDDHSGRIDCQGVRENGARRIERCDGPVGGSQKPVTVKPPGDRPRWIDGHRLGKRYSWRIKGDDLPLGCPQIAVSREAAAWVTIAPRNRACRIDAPDGGRAVAARAARNFDCRYLPVRCAQETFTRYGLGRKIPYDRPRRIDGEDFGTKGTTTTGDIDRRESAVPGAQEAVLRAARIQIRPRNRPGRVDARRRAAWIIYRGLYGAAIRHGEVVKVPGRRDFVLPGPSAAAHDAFRGPLPVNAGAALGIFRAGIHAPSCKRSSAASTGIKRRLPIFTERNLPLLIS